MSPTRAFLIYAALGSLASAAPVGVNDVYQEHGGILVMEAERTPSSLGTGTDRWETYTPGEANYVDGAAGEAHQDLAALGLRLQETLRTEIPPRRR